jgi:GT2 family glycosyltransferase
LVAHGLTQGLPPVTFSLILTSLPGTDRELRRTLVSLSRQLHNDWEVVLVSGSADWASLHELAQDPRWRGKVRLAPQGISGNLATVLNAGLQQARGPWVGFLESGHRLTPETLLWLRSCIAETPQARWLYSDETLGTAFRTRWNHKPDFSPEHLLSQFFTGNLSMYCLEDVRALGGLREQYGEACLYDLCLRLSERLTTAQIVHVPHALCHRPTAGPGGTEVTRWSEPRQAALQDALSRRKISAMPTRWEHDSALPRIRLRAIRQPAVTLIIATRNHAELVKPCVASARQQAGYENYEIVVIDNQSDEPELLDFLAEQTAAGALRVHRYDKPFNHSAMHNEVLDGLTAKYVVLLNNDVWGFSDHWLEELVATAEMDETIAVVGAQLFYPDDTIQHAGVILGPKCLPAYSHSGWPRDADGYFGRLQAFQEYSVVIGALALVRREAWVRVAGFDAESFPISYNDVDLCLRLRQAGYRCLYNPSVQAYHFEMKTRGRSPQDSEYYSRLTARWQHLGADPFNSPRLSLGERFEPDFQCGPCEELLRQLSLRAASDRT